jgi:hypothetical protein
VIFSPAAWITGREIKSILPHESRGQPERGKTSSSTLPLYNARHTPHAPSDSRGMRCIPVTMNQTQDKTSIPLELRYLDKHQAAEYLSCSPQFISLAVAKGQLKGFHPLRKLLRFRLVDLDSFMQSRQTPSR